MPVFEHKSEPGTAQNKAAAKTHCKAKAKASGMIKKRAVHKRPASAQELDDAPVQVLQDLNLYNAHCRQRQRQRQSDSVEGERQLKKDKQDREREREGRKKKER